jgi:LacI family transcriptional regulator
MPPKLKDVAKLAGVAVNTASSILNGRKDSWASQATKEKVFAAAKTLGYTPDRLARSLSTGKTRVVGLIVPNLPDPFFSALATEIGNELIRREYDLVIEDTRLDYQREILCLDQINHWRFDGLIVVPISLDILKSHLVPLAKRGTAVSVLGNHPKTASLGRIGVGLDQAIDEAFARLAALGHRRVGLLLHGQARQQSRISRVTKFEQALKKHHFDGAKPCVVNCEPTLESAHAAFRDLLERTKARDLPTAFVCMNDLLAIGAMRAAAEAGLAVPRDLSFIGVGDVPLARFLPVSLSSIAEPLEEMARAAVAQILDESPVEDVEFSATFVERESIGAAKG